MVRFIALSVAFGTLALPALAENAIDIATVTCKEFNKSSHQGMVDIAAAVYQSTREDPKLGPLTENQVGDMMDKVCAAKPDSKVIDALQQQ